MVILPLLLFSCVSVPVRHFADPGEFSRNLFHIVEHGEEREWGTQLTAERRNMKAAYVPEHFDRWRKTLIELKLAFGRPLEDVEFRVQDNGLEFFEDKKWNLLVRVMMEDGGWKINQD